MTTVPIVQSYTGYESEKSSIDTIVFQIPGIGKTIKPLPGWSSDCLQRKGVL